MNAEQTAAILARFERARTQEACESKLRATLAECLFRSDAKPPKIRPVFKLAGVTISTPGNLTTVTAHAKVGKTAFVGAMISATISTEGDTLSVSSSNRGGLAVVHVDSEQSADDHWNQIDRAIRRAKAEGEPPWLLSYHIAGKQARETLALVKQAVADARDKFKGVHSILIDGVADLVCDVNDAAECNAFVAELHGMAIEYDCPIICVIHLNPAGKDNKFQKVRGHLGSQIERKAETNLLLEKDGESTVIWSEKNRRAPILKAFGPRFKWDDEAAMHISCESQASSRDAQKLDQYRMELDKIFADRPAMRYGELKTTVMKALTAKERTAERRLADYAKLKLIKKSLGSTWERSI